MACVAVVITHVTELKIELRSAEANFVGTLCLSEKEKEKDFFDVRYFGFSTGYVRL